MVSRSPIRLKFGVAPITLYTRPADCGGACIFCPDTKGLPKSYIENEDTVYAASVDFQPEMQLSRLLKNILANRAPIEDDVPLEIIILGGSFSALDREYRAEFVQRIYDYLQHEISARNSSFRARCSVLTIESRPDQITHDECSFLRQLGVSKVEIGVQHTCDKVLRRSGRGHLQKQVIEATRLLKTSGFKVGYHVMLGLPGATQAKDITMLSQTLWYDQYYPDYLKIYPCELLADRALQPKLHRLYENNSWSPPSEKYCLEVLSITASYIPIHVRISRIQRQFDEEDILKGVGRGLRRKIQTPIVDIRRREIGLSNPDLTYDPDDGELICRYYEKKENSFFEVCYRDEYTLIAMARLISIPKMTPILRELKVFGTAASVGSVGQVQGKGLGTSLLLSVENKLRSEGYNMLRVNAAFGARSFFIKQGYELSDSHYMEKELCKGIRPNKPMQPTVITLRFTPAADG